MFERRTKKTYNTISSAKNLTNSRNNYIAYLLLPAAVIILPEALLIPFHWLAPIECMNKYSLSWMSHSEAKVIDFKEGPNYSNVSKKNLWEEKSLISRKKIEREKRSAKKQHKKKQQNFQKIRPILVVILPETLFFFGSSVNRSCVLKHGKISED